MRKWLLKILLSKKEITIIHDALYDMQCRCKGSLGESLQDTVKDISKLKRKMPEPEKNLYDIE